MSFLCAENSYRYFDITNANDSRLVELSSTEDTKTIFLRHEKIESSPFKRGQNGGGVILTNLTFELRKPPYLVEMCVDIAVLIRFLFSHGLPLAVNELHWIPTLTQ